LTAGIGSYVLSVSIPTPGSEIECFAGVSETYLGTEGDYIE